MDFIEAGITPAQREAIRNIEDYMKMCNTGVSIPDIAQGTGMQQTQVEQYVHKMKRQGNIMPVGDGNYRISQ